ncbi:hypothetical protein [Pedobacter hartonius]|uniref:Uncharacterized protein n=1 Tax=Pedobacter hartonius TaxID=425514 RepID=A0A1H3X7S8_9SPHI|nr:hypothetical protein [Pedobacter hartonius]SDZ95465.1 hypothetical protein SAMN05443550_101533 [Pedobacter hartonius]
MKTKNIKKDDLIQVPESTLMALVLSQIRGIVLFPEKIEAAKRQLKRINNKMAV